MPDGSVSASPDVSARSLAVGWSSFLTLLADEPGMYAPETLARVRAELGDCARVVAYVRAADAIEGVDELVVVGSNVERAAIEAHVGPLATASAHRRPVVPAPLVLRLFARAGREARTAA
ncbi:MAG: hypothetical protein R3B99_35930 [Polyangiales bacterium]|nr:hypothetical protein [Sandaracinus sp.]